MADSKLSALSSLPSAPADSDLVYVVRSGVSYKTTYQALKEAIADFAQYPEVANFAALPTASTVSGQTYVCVAAQGVYFVNRKPAGLYRSDGTNWVYLADATEAYFQDTLAWTNITSKPSTFAPSAHASSHGVAGSDPITVAQSQVTNLTTDLAGKLALSPDYIDFNTAATSSDVTGRLRWNDTDKCLEFVALDGVVIQIGQEQVVRGRNSTGSALLNGKAVYISGATGNRPTLALAKADAAATSNATIGLVTSDPSIANTADGFATTSGLVRGLDTSSFAEGAVLYLSDATAGELTATAPTASGSRVIRIGHVARSHATQGMILVHVDQGGTALGYSITEAATQAAARSALGLGNSSTLNVGTTAGTVAAGDDSRLSNARTPTAHASTHQSGGSDAIKLDDLATPDDNTDLDATTGRHGLLPKLGGGTTNFLRADGSWAAPASGGNVSSAGTPTSGQIAEWTSSSTIQGKATTGSGNVVLATSPTLVTPALGTPSALVLTNATGLPLSTGVTGNLPVANLNSGTGASATTFWRGDGTWATPSGGSSTTIRMLQEFTRIFGYQSNGAGFAYNIMSSAYGFAGLNFTPPTNEAKVRPFSGWGESDFSFSNFISPQILGHKTRIKTPTTLGDATNNYDLVFGFFGGGSWLPSQYMILMYNYNLNGGKWLARSKLSSETTQDTGITVAANTWYNLRVEGNSTSAKFFIDDVEVASISTNIPTASMGAQYQHYKQAGADRTSHLKFMEVYYTP